MTGERVSWYLCTLVCASYRAIKLLEQPMKVLERVLEKRIRCQVSIANMQFGFMPGKYSAHLHHTLAALKRDFPTSLVDPCPTQNKQISLSQIILTQSRRQKTSITTMPPLQHPHTRHTSSLQLHPHTHHIVTPGFVNGPRRSDCTAGQMNGEAGWWTIGLPPLARVMGVGSQQQQGYGPV